RQQSVALMTMLRGAHFVKLEEELAPGCVYFNSMEELQAWVAETGRPPLTQPEEMYGGSKIKAVVMLGHVRERDVHAATVLVPNGVERWEDCYRFAIVEYAPLENVRELARRKGLDPEVVQPVAV